MNFETIIGLEVHVELKTDSKMFSSAPVNFGAAPNTNTNVIDLGYPGVLPVVNKRAVDWAMKAAMALNCEITRHTKFDRKNYFYPDNPKAYQISQFDQPIGEHGWIEIEVKGEKKRIGITRLHMEEDAGKLTHTGNGHSLVDFNRQGTPLIEIVSEPDIRTADEAYAYLEKIKAIIQYTGVSDVRMEEGSLRCDANISLRPFGQDEFGTKTELKNLNSFNYVRKGIEHEEIRQEQVLLSGGIIQQETRRYDESTGKTVLMRVKEGSDDYRYFPEPDLPPVHISPKQITSARNSLPERPDRRFRRFMVDYGLEAYHTELLLSEKPIADFYENTLTYMSQPDPSLVANWITGELFGLMNISGQTMKEIIIEPRDLASLLDMLQNGEVNITTAKSVLSLMFDTGEKPALTIQKEGLGQISDRQILENIVEGVLSAHPDEVASYQEGKTGLREWFFGQVMQQTRGQANPSVVKSLLEEKLQQ